MAGEKILVWLPSPLGDAVMSTPALRSIREKFSQENITFLANDPVTQALSPSAFTDRWMSMEGSFFGLVARLKREKFARVILLKNSFGSALTVFAAGVPKRIGYAREGRGVFLTDKISPLITTGSETPCAMIDYYLMLCELIGCDIGNRQIELSVDKNDVDSLESIFPSLFDGSAPVVILVPGGSFGTSKCWPAIRFAETADRLIETYNAKVVISVAPNEIEKQIASSICSASKNELYNLSNTPLTLGQLKALCSKASLMITNDTGPRHIAIALGGKVVTLFGPNDPAWTKPGYDDEIEIVGIADCVPCAKPKCYKEEHLCMMSISVDHVVNAAEELLGR